MGKLEHTDGEDNMFRREADILSLYDKSPGDFIETVTEKLTETQVSMLHEFLLRNAAAKGIAAVEEIKRKTQDRLSLAIEIIEYFAEEKIQLRDIWVNNVLGQVAPPEEFDPQRSYSLFKESLEDMIRKPMHALHASQLEKGDTMHVVFSFLVAETSKEISFEMYLSVARVSKVNVIGVFYINGIAQGGWLVSGEFLFPVSSVIWRGTNAWGEGSRRWGSRSLERILPQIYAELPSESKLWFHELFISEMALMTEGDREVKAPGFWGRLLEQMKK